MKNKNFTKKERKKENLLPIYDCKGKSQNLGSKPLLFNEAVFMNDMELEKQLAPH